MKKNLLKIVCVALVTLLCIGNAFAQEKAASLSADHRPAHLYQNQEMKSFDNLPSNVALASQSLTRGHTAYGYIHYPSAHVGYWKWDVDAVQNKTLITSSLPVMYGGDYYDGTLYIYTDYESNPQFYKVNALTGAVISTTPRPELSVGPVSELSYDYSTNTMYALYQNAIHTVNLETGALTQIASLSGYTGTTVITMAVNLEGTMYITNMGTANLYTVNKTTGVCTLVGSTGRTTGYAQSMAFDHHDGTLYWAESENVDDNWMKINTTTGQATMIKAGAYETTALHFAFNNGPGIDPCPAVTAVTATLFESNKVKVNWTAPTVTTGLVNYKIYEGTTEKGTVPAGTTTWTSDALASGTYTFAVEAIYGPDCTPVKVAAAPITIATCDKKVSDLNVAYEPDCSKAAITWVAPPAKNRLEGWLKWIVTDDIVGRVGYGSDAGADMSIAMRFTPSDLQAAGVENGQKITKIGLGIGTQMNAVQTMEIKIWEGGTSVADAGTLKYTQAITGFASFPENTMKEIELTTPYTIDASKELRVEWRVDSRAGNGGYPFGADAVMTGSGPTTAVPQKGTLVKITDPVLFGGGWVCHVAQLNWKGNYSIKAYVEGTPGPIELKYNVYRDNQKIAGPLVEQTTFDDTNFNKVQPHTWSVAVICSNGGDGEWVNKDKNACYTPPTCPPVTNANVEFMGSTSALITWTAVEGAKGYKVNGVAVAGTEYTATGEFVIGETYTWNIVTVCEYNESDPVVASGTFDAIKDNVKTTFTLAPNPANDKIKVTAVTPFQTVEIVSFLGQTILSQVADGAAATLDVSTLPNGVYFVRITSENGVSVKKFVKQ